MKTRRLIVLLMALVLSSACSGPKEEEKLGDCCGPWGEVTQDGAGDVTGPDGAEPGDATIPDGVEPGDVAKPDGDASTSDEVEDQGSPPDVITGCPADSPPLQPGACEGELHCEYGEECCCGKCESSLVCDCMSGTWGCYYTDACLGPWCQVPPCCEAELDGSCNGGEAGVCKVQPGEAVGKCMPPVEAPQCWVDSDCKETETCIGASMCPCDADCDGIDTPGICEGQGIPPGCCYKDEDCDTGVDMAFVCGFPTPAADIGVCLPLPQTGKCWDSSDCQAGEKCEGPTFCECGMECGQIQSPGDCVTPPTPEVCKVDGQCPPGMRCVGQPWCDGPPDECPDAFGTCLPLPEAGLCWGDVDCAAGQVCVNPVFCPGGKVCLIDSHPGVCLDAPLNGCWADADCAPPINGMVFKCTGQWVIPWWTGNDYDAELDYEGECCPLKPGTCYEDADCLAGQECQGAIYPYTGACGDDADDEKPGQCVDKNPWPEELCLTDAECTLGQSCIGEWSCVPGLHCLEGEYPGLCLEDPVGALEWCYEVQHCAPGKSCDGPWVCDVIGGEMCGGAMAKPGLCEPVSYPPADVGEPCGPDGGECKSGLACCYPCGIPGCMFTCSLPCDPEEPWCSGGCAMVP
jgi:hypothetical protein